MNREVVKTFSAVSGERRRLPSEWLLALGAVQWALQFGVPRAHGNDAVSDDDRTTYGVTWRSAFGSSVSVCES